MLVIVKQHLIQIVRIDGPTEYSSCILAAIRSVPECQDAKKMKGAGNAAVEVGDKRDAVDGAESNTPKKIELSNKRAPWPSQEQLKNANFI